MSVTMTWKVCPRFSAYEVSECGDLRRRSGVGVNQPGRRLNGVIDSDGYIRYSVQRLDGSKTSIGAHQLVAEAFLGPRPSPGHEVAHNNGSRLLNTPGNLRWSTHAANQRDRQVHKTHAAGVRNGRATITEDDVRYIRRRYREIKLERGSVAELDRQFGLSRGHIIEIAKRKAWAHVD